MLTAHTDLDKLIFGWVSLADVVAAGAPALHGPGRGHATGVVVTRCDVLVEAPVRDTTVRP
jgi:hypothetical protein